MRWTRHLGFLAVLLLGLACVHSNRAAASEAKASRANRFRKAATRPAAASGARAEKGGEDKARARAKKASPAKRKPEKAEVRKGDTPSSASKPEPKTRKATPRRPAVKPARTKAAPRAGAKGWARVERSPVKVATPKGVRDVPIPLFVNKIGMRFARIRPGEFSMGSPPAEPGRNLDERAHPVTIPYAYYMSATEVTVGQWRRFVKAADYGWDHRTQLKLTSPTEDHPVCYVSWEDAAAFAQWLSKLDGHTYRLPTEAEWEYACRAGTTGPFAFGETMRPELAAYGGDEVTSSPVGRHPANRWGLFDMHGNVWEWCRDWYEKEYYASAPTTAPAGPAEGIARVIRGGSWQDGPDYCRSANRSGRWPGGQYEDLGFRVVRDDR